jgi:outer membrane protein with beta-barrel domain
MMKRLIGVIVVVLAMATSASLAGPLYFGASVGETKIKAEESGFNFDGSATSYKIYAGYRFFKFFGVEASYLDFGSPDDSSGGTDVSVSATGWDAFAVGVLPFGKHFEIFGKYGLVFWNSDTDVSGSGTNSDSGNDTVYGAGLAFIFGKHLGVRGEYERYNIQNTDSVDIVSIGADFRF